MTTSEDVLVYGACSELRRLYEAYQLSALAHRLVLARMEPELASSGTSRTPDEQLTALLELSGRDALAAQTEAVFARRSEQLRQRMLILRGFRSGS